MKAHLIYCFLLTLPIAIFAANEKPYPIHTEVYRLGKQGLLFGVDMAIDLSQVRLAPDCTVLLSPLLKSGDSSDSIQLPPIMVNGPQSDLMYRRRKKLGKMKEIENVKPYLVLRESIHALPCVSYRVQVPYQEWMEGATVGMRAVSINSDSRLATFAFTFGTVSPVIVERVDTVVVRDTVRMNVPGEHLVTKRVEEQEGRRGEVFFLKREAVVDLGYLNNAFVWEEFINELDSLCFFGNERQVRIEVTGYSSPEDSYTLNDQLARWRASELRDVIDRRYGAGIFDVRTEWVAEDWEGLAKLLQESDMSRKEEVLNMINTVGIFQGREMKIRLMDENKTWLWMMEQLFPKLRRGVCRVVYLNEKGER